MAINLTNIKAQLNDIKRNLFFEDSSLKFINISKVLLELDGGWYLNKHSEKELSSPEFYLLSVVDSNSDLNLDSIIPLTITVKIGDVEYSIIEYSRPKDLTKEWKLKLQTAQMMKRNVN